MALPAVFEIVVLIVLVLVLAADLVLAYRRPHVPRPAESLAWIAFYVALALGLAVAIAVTGGGELAGQFVAGWLTEYSLSVDNLFVFLVIMARFAVPERLQQEVLMAGILIALALRGAVIAVGAQLIASFSWIFYLFGAFLVVTAVRQALDRGGKDDEEGRLMRFLRRRLKVTPEFDGSHVVTRVDGRRMLTPMLLVLVALGSTDLLFALDSIPAVFGITESAFIVFAANILALMGLRQLYFLLGHLLERLVFLKYGIAVVLAFIGVKLVLHALRHNTLPFLAGGRHLTAVPEIGTLVSLAVIVVAMGAATIASLVVSRRATDGSAQE